MMETKSNTFTTGFFGESQIVIVEFVIDATTWICMGVTSV